MSQFKICDWLREPDNSSYMAENIPENLFYMPENSFHKKIMSFLAYKTNVLSLAFRELRRTCTRISVFSL